MSAILDWFSGLVDGEGSFGAYWHTPRHLNVCFTLGLRADDRATLLLIKETLGVGQLYEKKTSGAPQVQYRIQHASAALRLIEVLDAHPLRSKKARDYATWRKIVVELQTPRKERDLLLLRMLASQLRDERAYRD